MNWNAKPETVTLPPLYPKNQSSFLEPSLINTPSQGSLNSPGSNQPACMFLSNSNAVSQPLLNIRNYKTTQQISLSDMSSRTVFASQASVERITSANVKGPKQLNHSLQMSSGIAQNVWSKSPVRNSVFSHTGPTVSQQTGFRTNIPNVNALQNQFVTSETYFMQGQMVPSNSVRVPITYQGNQRLTSSLSERQGDWAQQYTPNGVTYPDYRSLPEQYSYPSQSFLQCPTLQKQNPMPLTSLRVKNSHPPNSSLTLRSKQTALVPSYQYAAPQMDKRPLPPYDCRYASQPLQNTQHVIQHSSVEVPQSQEAHVSEMRKDFCRGFQQQNLNENVSMIGNLCNVKVNTNVSQPFNDPIRSSVDGVQILPQHIQEERVDSCNLTSNQVLDTSFTKEKLVRDIKTLVEIKKKFSELARKIKINKILLSAGCIKTSKNSYGELAQNSELSLKQTAKTQSGPQVNLVTPETAGDKPPTVMETAEETNRTHSALSPNIQDTHCLNFNQVNSMFLNSVCAGKVAVPDQLHNLNVTTSLKTSPVESTHAALNNTQLSSANAVSVENVQTNPETNFVPQSLAFEEYASKHLNKNRLLLGLLAHGDKIEKTLVKDGCETIQHSKPHSFEMKSNTQVTGNQVNLKTMETASPCNINGKISQNAFCLDHKPSPNGITPKSDGHCSMELITTCLSLWKKQSSEPTGKKQCNEFTTNRTTVGLSKPGEVCDKTPVSVVGNSQNKVVNCSEVTTLPMVVQNYEASGAAITKGTELQIAVVSPLILSDMKTLPVKGITSEPLPETVYPVIKEGSVCSLQNQLIENTRVTAALKVKEPVTSTTNTKIFPLIQKEKQNAPTNGDSEGTPNTNQGNHVKSEPDTHCPVSDQQASSKSRDSDTVNSDLLKIDNICSLVEGDTSYNSQIAKIFNPPPVKKDEPQEPLPNLQVTSSRQQKEQIDNVPENKEFGLQKDSFVQYRGVSHKIPDQSQSLQPPESSLLKNVEASSEVIEESNLKHITKKESTAKDTCLSTIQQDGNPQEIDVSCSYTAQDPAANEILDDNTSTLYPHDQLSELLKEFPYGIEAVNTTCEGSLTQQITDRISKDESCDKTSCDSKDSTDQIKITILNSEQMKELFPEQNHQPFEVGKLTEPEKENPVTKEGSQCDPQVRTDGENCNSVMAFEKDDIRCCALGWLSMVYEGVPKCQCNSIKDSTSKVEKGKDQCSLETNSCKQGESTCDRDVSIVLNSPPNNSPKTALSFPDGTNHFPEIEQGNNIKDISKTKSSRRTEQELSSQPLSKGDTKLDSLESHKRKGKLKFHEVTFHSGNKIKFPRESLQRKLIIQNSGLLKAKAGSLKIKSKDLQMKNGSLIHPMLPEKRTLKAGDSEQKISGKRRSAEGSMLHSEIKRVKYDKQEQDKNGGGTFKIRSSLSNTDGRAKVKEKIVSVVKSSCSKDSKRVISPKEYLKRQKLKEMMKASRKNDGENIPCDSQYVRSSKLSVQVGSCGESHEGPSSSVQTSKESLSTCTSQVLDKNLKPHHSGVSKSSLSGSVKETVGRKQADKMWIDKAKLDKNLSSINNGVERSQMSPQAKEQRKQYLNRVAFKCTEHQSICLTKLESLPKKSNKDKRMENKPKKLLPKKNTEKRSMLEFKLCPDGLINKNTNSIEVQKDLQPCPRKEQATVQVTGIKSTKEDWIKGSLEEKRIPEANQEIDDNGLANSRNAKRTFSADGFETLQNPVKDSKRIFQSYKKMYLEKRSRSLGSSPLK